MFLLPLTFDKQSSVMKHVFSSFLFLLLLSCQSKKTDSPANESPVVVKEQIAVSELPNLNVIDVNGTAMSLHELPGEVAIIFFNPDCDHFQREAKDMIAKKELLKN